MWVPFHLMGRYRVSGWFVNHDYRYTGLAELVVDRDAPPTEAEAEPLLWLVADEQMQLRYSGDERGNVPWRNEFTGVTVRSQPVLAVTGATGALGGLVAARVAHYAPLLIVRDPSRAPELGLAVRRCDYADASLAALRDVEVLFMVSAAEAPDRRAQHRTFVRAAAEAGVAHIVYTSFCGAAPDATFTLARDHFDTEQAIRDSGMAFTILRNNFYADVLPDFADDNGVIRGPAGDGQVAAVARADVADVAAAVLRDPERHAGKTYTLTGPEALTLTDVAALAGAVLGRAMRFEDETLQQAYTWRAAAFDAEQWQLDAWVSTYTAIADGSCAQVTDDIDTVALHRARTLEEALGAQGSRP
ncbi:hypothetical protein BH09ACT7_BH09ACT7_35790 [soil metagenome]